jgi:hypothetical protein
MLRKQPSGIKKRFSGEIKNLEKVVKSSFLQQLDEYRHNKIEKDNILRVYQI